VLAAAVARGVYHTAHKPLLSRYTGFEVTVYADVAGPQFVLPRSPALVRALPHAGTAARSGLCGRLRPGDPRIRHRRPLTDDPAEHGTAKRTLMPPTVRCLPSRWVYGVWVPVAVDGVVQVQHAVSLDHHVWVVEEDGAGVAAEEPYPFAHDHRDDVHRYLVDEARRERLSADVARAHADQTVTGQFLGEGDAGLDRVGCVERRVGEPREPLLRQRPVGDDDEFVPAAGTPAQPSVVSNRWRPITVILMASQMGCT
jgi:hypothetical protein